MNWIGPCIVIFCLLLNMWTVAIFFVFPFTDFIDSKLQISSNGGSSIHYVLFSIYLVLLILTIWSFISASCLDPGTVPKNKTTYEKSKLSQREHLLWNYLERLGFSPDLLQLQEQH